MQDMQSSEERIDSELFRTHVRHALEHLYDVDALSEHWLIDRLHLDHEPARARALRQYLVDAIQRMRPQPQEPPDTPHWQMYQVLLQRYVQHRSANALADQLGTSSRNLRRLQSRAIAQLTEILIQQAYQDEASGVTSTAVRAEQQPAERAKTVNEELRWLQEAVLSEPVDLRPLLAEVLAMIEPATRSAQVRIGNTVSSGLPNVVIHPTGLRQVLLSALNFVVQHAAAGTVRLSASTANGKVTITLESLPDEPATTRRDLEPGLVVAQRILTLFGGRIRQTQAPDGRLCLQISLVKAGETTVLVIDDNPDALQLYERYVIGSRYQLVVCEKPEQALELAVTAKPQVIVIDIMMPGLDGWSLLGKLRHHPLTAAVPVIICTIVSEHNLAFSLGAAGFVTKPVSREAFLSALDRQIAATAPTSH